MRIDGGYQKGLGPRASGVGPQACPVDCIHPRSEESDFESATQMYVNPAECIDCGACIPACTSDAIFALDDVPADKRNFIEVIEAFYAAR
jgi:NAD-dependent dihydropyrimidine dehydrogenase PreA subunit